MSNIYHWVDLTYTWQWTHNQKKEFLLCYIKKYFWINMQIFLSTLCVSLTLISIRNMAENKRFPHFHEAYFPWVKSGMNEKKQNQNCIWQRVITTMNKHKAKEWDRKWYLKGSKLGNMINNVLSDKVTFVHTKTKVWTPE